jgi:hypothetical protein
MTQETIDGNKLIAEFMSMRCTNKSGGIFRNASDTASFSIILSPGCTQVRYDCSFDWLMPVVEKIGAIHGSIEILPNRCTISHGFIQAKKISKECGIPFDEVPPIAEHGGASLMENIYNAVVAFIKWHNQQKEK